MTMDFKSIIGKVTGLFSSEGAVKDLGDIADRFIETGAEKREFQLEVQQWAHKKEMEVNQQANEAQELLTKQVSALEGTAKDLLQAGWLGRVVLFLRGLQRPLWGYSTLYFIWRYYSGQIDHTEENYLLTLTLVLLVGGFLFGERAIKNVAPFIKELLEARNKKKE